MMALVVLTAIVSLAAGCPEEDPKVPGLAGTDGRSRYVVTMSTTPVNLEEFRTLQREKPDEVAAYVAKKRAETAAAQADLDQVVNGFGGKVVHRWWMSGQATIEVSAGAVATVRAVPGVTQVEPDRPLQ